MAEVLVVASKIKKLIKEKGDCNTSSSTMEALSERLHKGIENAKADGRKTVMDRDIPNLGI